MGLVKLPLVSDGNSRFEIEPTVKSSEWDKFRSLGQQMLKRSQELRGAVDFSYASRFVANPLALYYRPSTHLPLHPLMYDVWNSGGEAERVEQLSLGFAMVMDSVQVQIGGDTEHPPIRVEGTFEGDAVVAGLHNFTALNNYVVLGCAPVTTDLF